MIRSAKALLLAVSLGCLMFGQTPVETPTPDNKAGAYYNFAMGRVYAELAQAYGNKPDYLTKAIQHYQEALKLDPGASLVFEELTDLYIQTNHLRDAITQAEEMLKISPDNVDARRMLGRIYMKMISTPDNRINEDYLKKAIEQLQKVTDKEPKDSESWVALGRLYRVANNSVDAEKAYNKALEAEPDNEEALTGLAMLYSDLGDNKRAIEKLKLATEKDPNERTLIALGQAYEQIHDYKNAADTLKQALEMAPDNTRLQAGLANNLMLSDRVEEALSIFQKLSEEDPTNPQPKLRIAEIYRVKHDYVKSADALKKAKALSPEDMEVRYEEVRLLEAQVKYTEAIGILKGLVDETTRPKYSASEGAARGQLLEELGSLYRSNAQYTESVDAYRKASALNKENSDAITLQIIDTYRAAKNTDGVRKEVESSAAELRARMKGKPDMPGLLMLASFYEKGKYFAEEAKVLDEAEKIAANPKEKESVYFMRGAMFERQKKVEPAEAEFRKVLASNPEHSGALNYLGYMLVDRKLRVEEATQMIKKALDGDPENGAYLDSLGWAYYQQGKFEEAEGLLTRALDRIGEDPTVHDHLGDVYFKLGKIKEAITQWQASLKDFRSPAGLDSEPEDVTKVTKKLDAARVKLAKEK
ncbi:MAG: tetratricopeptide repeat protein [Candidatus Solibacter sp.]|jgi:tetratricopeptide (TPR) repeat protein